MNYKKVIILHEKYITLELKKKKKRFTVVSQGIPEIIYTKLLGIHLNVIWQIERPLKRYSEVRSLPKTCVNM